MSVQFPLEFHYDIQQTHHAIRMFSPFTHAVTPLAGRPLPILASEIYPFRLTAAASICSLLEWVFNWVITNSDDLLIMKC